LNTHRVIYLVSCVKEKISSPSPAKDLYTSRLFECSKELVIFSINVLRQRGVEAEWFILSAKYGLVHPDEVLAPYNLTLNDMGLRERRNWSLKVYKELKQHLERKGLPKDVCIIFLAGKKYREFLMKWLRRDGYMVVNAWEGLRGIGYILRWCNEILGTLKEKGSPPTCT